MGGALSERETGPMIACGCGCGTMIEQFDDRNRERVYAKGHYMNTLWRSFKKQEQPAPK